MKLETKRNIIFTAAVLLLAAVIYLMTVRRKTDGEKEAQIYFDSKLVKTISLEEGKEEIFTIPKIPQVAFHQYPDGTICFESSDCPDKVCIKSGRLGIPGQSAACLPNKLVIKITGGKAGEGLDALGN